MSEEMTYGHLGRSGLLVSRIGLGTMNFGYTVDEPSSFAVMDAAIDAGINFFDTADVYGGPQSPDMKKGHGIAEETVGRWLQRSGHRDDIVLATKVYQPMGLGPNDRRLSAYHIRRACEASLRRLQTDHIDLYQSTTSTGPRRGRRSGKQWSSWSARARSATSAAATSPPGMWPSPSAPPRHGSSWA
jgi:aryl-alcohol dehydrogenase-like predicted oxidoreductase